MDEDSFVNKRSGYEIGNVCQSIDLSRRRKSDRSFHSYNCFSKLSRIIR